MSVEGAYAHAVTLAALALERRIETEGELHVAHIEMGIEGVETDEMACEGGAEPIARLGLNEEVTPLHMVLGTSGIAFAERYQRTVNMDRAADGV